VSPATIRLAIAAGALLAAFLAGWWVNGWRMGAQVAELRGTVNTQRQSIATLDGANKRCVAGVADVRTAVKGMVDAQEQRSAATQAAIERASRAAVGHLEAAKAALARPPAAKGEECGTVAREAVEYSKRRRSTP